MAIVKLEMSEYEALKKQTEIAEQRAEDLKTSKEQIDELHKEIDRKNQEKIQIMKDNEKKVVIIRKKHIMQTLSTPYGNKDEMIRYIISMIYREIGGNSFSANFDSIMDRGYSRYSTIEDRLRRVFDFHTSEAIEEKDEDIEYVGLNDVIKDIREKEYKKLDGETKSKLMAHSELREKYDKLAIENNDLRQSNISTQNDRDELIAENIQLENKTHQLHEEIKFYQEFRDDALEVIDDKKLNFFNAYFRIKKVSDDFYKKAEISAAKIKKIKEDGTNR